MQSTVIGDNSTIPVVFESSSVLGVQLLQSFISVVVMLLLLLSGDVETNPGPSKCATCSTSRTRTNTSIYSYMPALTVKRISCTHAYQVSVALVVLMGEVINK